MENIKGLLIKASEIVSTITKVEFEDTLSTLYELVNCELVEMPTRRINGKAYTFIVDEEGLLKDNLIPTACSKDKREYLVGNILIVNGPINNDGNIHSLTDKDYKNILTAFNPLYGLLIYDF